MRTEGQEENSARRL